MIPTVASTTGTIAYPFCPAMKTSGQKGSLGTINTSRVMLMMCAMTWMTMYLLAPMVTQYQRMDYVAPPNDVNIQYKWTYSPDAMAMVEDLHNYVQFEELGHGEG